MKSKTQLAAVALTLAIATLAIAPRTVAQHSHDHKAAVDWKKGMLRLSNPAWAGNVRLKDRMYHVKHVVDGDKHLLIFKSVTLRAGYQGGLMWEGKEVARLECRVEPVAKSVSNTKVKFGRNAAGERVIEEIQIAGEKVKHVLSGGTAQWEPWRR
ncbi:MAG TPA: hypothetical protein VIT88_09800 [Pyrinomonadaceae bacterium]